MARLRATSGLPLSFRRQPPNRGPDLMSTLSVVIVTRNRREEVMRLLSDLSTMPGEGADEILVVDNGSADGTAEALRRQFPSVQQIRFAENRGAPAARNAGAAGTRGNILVFLDDDTRVEDQRFLERVRRIFDAEKEA